MELIDDLNFTFSFVPGKFLRRGTFYVFTDEWGTSPTSPVFSVKAKSFEDGYEKAETWYKLKFPAY